MKKSELRYRLFWVGKGKHLKHTDRADTNTFGPASPVRRIDPQTGQITEIIPATSKAPLRQKSPRDDTDRWIARELWRRRSVQRQRKSRRRA
jgi:hypothetical protein